MRRANATSVKAAYGTATSTVLGATPRPDSEASAAEWQYCMDPKTEQVFWVNHTTKKISLKAPPAGHTQHSNSSHSGNTGGEGGGEEKADAGRTGEADSNSSVSPGKNGMSSPFLSTTSVEEIFVQKEGVQSACDSASVSKKYVLPQRTRPPSQLTFAEAHAPDSAAAQHQVTQSAAAKQQKQQIEQQKHQQGQFQEQYTKQCKSTQYEQHKSAEDASHAATRVSSGVSSSRVSSRPASETPSASEGDASTNNLKELKTSQEQDKTQENHPNVFESAAAIQKQTTESGAAAKDLEATVKLQVTDGSKRDTFRVKITAPIHKLLEKYCSKRGLDMFDYSFTFENTVLTGSETPGDLNLAHLSNIVCTRTEAAALAQLQVVDSNESEEEMNALGLQQGE